MLPILTGLLAVLASPPAADSSRYPDLPAPVSSFGAAVIGEAVYVYGGHTGKAHSYSTETTLGELRRLDLKNPTKWQSLPGGPKLQGLALVSYRGRLVRVGGMQPQNGKGEKTDTKSMTTCAMFEPKSGKWTDIDPLPEGRSSHDAAVAGDTLYVFGGWTLNGRDGKSEWLDHGWALDLAKWGSKWKKVEQPFQRRALTMAAVAGKVYVIGGLNTKGEMELTVNVFDPKAGKWSEGPPLPGEKMNGFTPASAVMDGRLYVTPADGKVYRLTEKGDQWEEVAKLQTPRFVARMVADQRGKLIVIAGASPGGLLASVEAADVGSR